VSLQEIEQRHDNVASGPDGFKPATVNSAGVAELTFRWPRRYLLCRGTGGYPPPRECIKPWELRHRAIVDACYGGSTGNTLDGCVQTTVLVLPSLKQPAHRALPILVLGDSYSAGNGAGDYYGAKGCWRSRRNYAEDYARLIEAAPFRQLATVTNAACSGATTSWFFNSEHGRAPELHAVNKSYDVIFLTVGGDDINFKAIVQNCLIQATRDGRKCNELLSAAEKDLRDGTLQARIVDVLKGIRHRAGPHARIVLLGYPYIDGQEQYQLPYDHGKSIDVAKRLRALEDVGDQVQQRAIGQVNAKYSTSEFVFVKTKRLFAGHELYALSLNPNRWFIAPETDAGLAYLAEWYHPNPTGWYEEAQLLLSASRVPKHPAG
jgi:lysophospholipase L1-like esterase